MARSSVQGARAGRRVPRPPGVWLALLMALLLALFVGLAGLTGASVSAQAEEGEIENLRLSSASPGELVIEWDAPSETPSDYRVSWAPSGSDFPSWRDENASDRGNAYPTSATHTVTGLPDGEYKVQVRARYRHGKHAKDRWSGPWSDEVTLTIPAPPEPDPDPPANRGPSFPSSAETLAVDENTATGAVVGTVAATDEDGDTLTYSVPGGATSFNDNFSLDAASAQITVKTGAALDYETTTSYTVTVTVADPGGLADTVAVTVNVNNLDETGTVNIGSAQPSEGTALTASLTDPDGGITGESWQWSRADSAAGSFTNIGGATSSSYTPVSGDAGKYLRATVDYSDAQGPGKSAVATLQSAVTAAPARDGSISGLALSSDDAGTLTIRWEAASPAPSDYRVSWAPVGQDYLSWNAANEAARGSEYPGGGETTLTLTGLTRGAEFKVRMRARYNAGEHAADPWSGPWTDEATRRVMGDPPAAPTGLSAEHSIDESRTYVVALSWTAPDHDDITGYRIWRGADAGSLSVLVNDTGNTATTYTDATAQADTSYAYAVTALSLDGDSPRSDTATIDRESGGDIGTNDPPANDEAGGTTAPAFPDADSDGSADAVTLSVAENAADGTAVGTVSATDDDGDAPTYSVGGTAAQRAAFNGVFELDASTGAITVKTGAALDHETTASYAFTIEVTDAEDAEGNAQDPAVTDDTAAVTVSVTNVDEAGTVTLDPAALRVDSATTASLSDPDGGETGLSWQWQRSATETGAYADIPSATSAAYTPAAADLSQWLKATVSYTDGQGTGKSASGTAVQVQEAEPPARGAIAELTLTSDEYGYLGVSWSAADPVPDCYLINWAESGTAFAGRGDALWNFCQSAADGTSSGFDDSIVVAGKTYQVRVRGEYRTGTGAPWNGPWSPVATQYVLDHAPQAPTGLRIDSAGHDGVSLSWTAPDHDTLTGYRVLRGASADALAELATVAEGVTSYDNTVTEGGATYVYAVVALSLDGDSPRSGTVTASLPPRTPVTPVVEGAPAVPTGLAAALDGSGGVTLTWTDPDDSGITGYRVLRGADAASLAIIAADTGSAAVSYTDASPATDTTMVYAVQARNAAGLGQLSATATATALSAPDELTADADAFAVELDWSGPDHSAVSGYQVLRGTSADALEVIAVDTASANTGYLDFGVEPETTYHYAVRARSAQGLGPQSKTLEVTTPSGLIFIDPETGQQQTSVVLASNSGSGDPAIQVHELYSRTRNRTMTGMTFTTGRHPSGYNLSGVRLTMGGAIDLGIFGSANGRAGWAQPRVNIHAVSGSGFGARLGRLTAGTVSAGASRGDITLSASSPITLAPNTSYWLIPDAAGSSALWLRAAPQGSSRDTCGELDWIVSGHSRAIHYAPGTSETPQFTSTSKHPPLAVTLLGSQITTKSASERECDDSPASASTTLKVASGIGGHAIGAFQTPRDHDRFAVALEANTHYEFHVYGAARGGGTTANTEIHKIYNANGVEQTIHRVEGGLHTGNSWYYRVRAYFTTPSSGAGTYYVEVAPRTGEKVIELTDGRRHRSSVPTYSLRMRKADDYPASTATTAQVAPGGTVSGFFYTAHNSMTDVDWVKVTLKQDVSYHFGLRVRGSAVNRMKIDGIRDSAGSEVTAGVNDDFAYASGGSAWANLQFTPTAAGTYYVALSSGVYTHSGAGRHQAPAWTLRMWSSDMATKSEPARGDLPGPWDHDNGHVYRSEEVLLGSGIVANDGTVAAGRTPDKDDNDTYAVWLTKDTRYRINAYQTAHDDTCMQLAVYTIPPVDVESFPVNGVAVPHPSGSTTMFFTPAKSGVYLVNVSNGILYTSTAGPTHHSCAGPVSVGTDPRQFDWASSYHLIVHPAAHSRAGTACPVGRTTAWLVPGEPVTMNDIYAGLSLAAGLTCQFEMELTEGNSYTVDIVSPDNPRTTTLVTPSHRVIERNGTWSSFTFTATEAGIHRVQVQDGRSFFSDDLKVTLTDNGKDESYILREPDEHLILVSNHRQHHKRSWHLKHYDAAQSFTTGPGEFRLDSIGLALRPLLLQDDPVELAAPRVRLVSGSPDSTGGIELTGPEQVNRTLGGDPQMYEYTAPADTVLSASTTYWVVVEAASGGRSVEWAVTFSDDEDGHGAQGWSIGDTSRLRPAAESSSSPFSHTHRGSFMMRVKGVAK